MAPGPLGAPSMLHLIVRQLFSRLVFTLQFETTISMEIISFWLWLEGIGHADFLASIDSLNNYDLRSIASAAKMFIEALRLKSSQPNHRSGEGGYFQKEAVKGIVFYLNNVCYKVLVDILEVAEAKERICRAAHHQAQQQIVRGRAPMTTRDLLSKIKASYISASARSQDQGSSSRSMPSPKIHVLKDIENPIEQCLATYPLATLFESLNIKEVEEEPADAIQIPKQPIIPRDERTLFVTFSNGYPFTADELYEFFMGNFGDVEVISVQEPIEPKPPLYAHITFYNQESLFRVLAGHTRVKFVIRGKHLWARKFVPKRKKAQKSILS